MAVISMQEIAMHLRNAGFPESSIATMVAIAYAESGGESTAVNDSEMGVTEYSVGIFQINLLAHPSVTEECAMNPACAAKEAFRISNSGTNFNPWSVYKNGRYLTYLDDATKVAKETLITAAKFIEGLTKDQLADAIIKAGPDVVIDIVNKLPAPIRILVEPLMDTGLKAALIVIDESRLKSIVGSLPGDVVERIAKAAGWAVGAFDDAGSIIPGYDEAKEVAEFFGRINDISMDDIKNAGLSVVLIGVAGALIMMGLYGIVNQTKIGKTVIENTKTGAVVAATKGKAA